MAIQIDAIKKKEKQKEKGESLFQRLLQQEISFKSNKINDSKKQQLYDELSVLLAAGVNIKDVLDIILEEQKDKKLKHVYQQIIENLVSGMSFSEAIHASGQFSDYEYYSIKIAEETGNLIEVLNELKAYFEGKVAQKRMIVNMMSYPIIITLTAFGAIFFMIRFMVPMFRDVFVRIGGDLPPLTKFVLSISDFFTHYSGRLFLISIICLVLGVTVYRKERYKVPISKLVLKIPLVGVFIKKTNTLLAMRAMALLLSSKNPLSESIDLIVKMIRFRPLKQVFQEVSDDIKRGEELYKSMAKHDFFDHKTISLIRVGEETNTLGYMFENIANQTSKELAYKSKVLSSSLEPIVIVLLGIIVAVILIAMYLPMFKMTTVMG